jgi:hypothetical protein
MTLFSLLRARWRRRWRNDGTQLLLRGAAWGPAVPGSLLNLSPLVGVAGLGGLGLATVSLWLPRLEAALRHRRHAMLRGFRGGWLSPHEWHW